MVAYKMVGRPYYFMLWVGPKVGGTTRLIPTHPHIDRELDLLQKQLLLHQWLNRLLRLLLLGQQNHNQLHNPIYWVNCWIPCRIVGLDLELLPCL